MSENEIPFDKWTQVLNEELAIKGLAEWVYRPSDYNGPHVIDGVLSKICIDAPGTVITLTKEEAKIIFPDKKPKKD